MMTDEERLRLALTRFARPSSDFDLNPTIVLPEGRILRPAAVLVVVWLRPEGARLVLTKRSSHLQHHPGQIAFPGGKVDASDNGAVEAALREAQEEIGLPTGQIEVLGELPAHETVTGFSVTPVLVFLRGDFTPVLEVGEVDEVFDVPLSHLLVLEQYRIEGHRWRGGWRRYYAVPWGPYYIWGATALILYGLAARVQG